MEATPLTASQEIDILANFGHLSDDDEVSVNLILSSEDEILSDSEDDYLICVDTDEEEELEADGNQGGGGAVPEKTVSNDNNGEKEPFTIRCIGHQDAPRFGTTQTSYTVNFDQEYLDNAHQSANPDQTLAYGMDLMIRRIGIMQDLAPGDRISITISHPELDVDVRIPFVRFEHMVSNLLLSAVDHVAQSKTNFCFDMGIKIKVTVVRNPDNVGSGRGVGRTTRRSTKTVREFLKNLLL